MFFTLFFLLFIQINSQTMPWLEIVTAWTKNQFEEMCSIHLEDDFLTHLNSEFKKEYPKACDDGKYYGWDGTEVKCIEWMNGTYVRGDYVICDCGNGFISSEQTQRKCVECDYQ